MKILKLAVTRSSTLVAPPSSGGMSYHWETASGSNFAETDLYFKKELPGGLELILIIVQNFQDAPPWHGERAFQWLISVKLYYILA